MKKYEQPEIELINLEGVGILTQASPGDIDDLKPTDPVIPF